VGTPPENFIEVLVTDQDGRIIPRPGGTEDGQNKSRSLHPKKSPSALVPETEGPLRGDYGVRENVRGP